MTDAVGVSELSLMNDMLHLDIISNNLANANTAGYKRDIVVTNHFDAVLNDAISISATDIWPSGQADPFPRVHRITDSSSGALNYTGNPLDMAIEGDAFFELMDSGRVRYSRQGAFTMDSAGRLVNSSGLVVSGEEGEILLHGGEVTIDRQGNVHEDGEYAGRMKLMAFKDLSALTKVGSGMWAAPAGVMGQWADDAQVRQGYVESSNVKTMEEMVRMMTTLRHFETTANVIKGYDEMMNTAISTIAEF
ncbi:MAG: flagellar hook basal-body protein [Desulfobacteraceae bacterium]|jgi:flagellar basal-body rod protein FlgG